MPFINSIPPNGTLWKVLALVFTAGIAWAAVDTQFRQHIESTTELVEVSKEICYAIHRHVGADPRPCYDRQSRGRRW